MAKNARARVPRATNEYKKRQALQEQGRAAMGHLCSFGASKTHIFI